MSEIAINYQPHQPSKTFKFPETIYGQEKHLRHCELFCEESEKKAFNFRPILNLEKGLIS